MRRGFSWVEMDSIRANNDRARFVSALQMKPCSLTCDWPPAPFISGHGIAEAGLIFLAIWIAAVGSSLFLVRPLLLLGARAPLWLGCSVRYSPLSVLRTRVPHVESKRHLFRSTI